MEASFNKCINILLLGETGNGKSTLVNAFANYHAYKTFDEAKDGQEVCLIPTKFTFVDEDMKETLVMAGKEDANECLEIGQSATMSCKSYVFQLTDQQNVRFIDSSGFGATQGVHQDEDTVCDVIDYTSQFQYVNALAIVVKAKQNYLSRQFDNCLEPLMDKFGPLAFKNIIVIFTHCKKIDQTLKLTREKLTKIMKELKAKEVTFNKQNIFCFENEAFRNLLALKRGAEMTNTDNGKMWEIASKEFQRLIINLRNKIPLTIPLTLIEIQIFARSLNSVIENILMNINFNIQNLMEKQKELISEEVFHNSPVVKISNINVETLENRIIVCGSKSCAEIYKLSDGSVKEIYLQTCCEGCGNSHWKINRCKIMKKGVCSKCKCKTKHHLEYAFKTTKEEEEMYEYYCEFEKATKMINDYIDELVREKGKIIDGIKQLINFLIYNSVSIKETNHSIDKKIAKRLYHLAVGQKFKLNQNTPALSVSAEEMQETIEILKSLQINGSKITTAYKIEESSHKKNRIGRETVINSKTSNFRKS